MVLLMGMQASQRRSGGAGLGLDLAAGLFEEPSAALRVLFPSPIGDLGLTLQDQTVISLVIAPPRRELALYADLLELPDSEFLEEMFGRLSEFFAGARPSPDIDYDLAPSGLSNFARRVLRETAKIPWGRTRTYRKIAASSGKPEAYRQVLSILASNPIPILVPCHRVVTSKSGIGSYIGGQERKQWLLDMEREGPPTDPG